MSVETLIEEMQQCKQDNPALEITDVLRIFNIQAIKDQTDQLRRLANGR